MQDLGYVLKVKWTKFANGLDIGCERKRGTKYIYFWLES